MIRLSVALLAVLACAAPADGNPIRDLPLLKKTNRKLHGRVLDYTNNHGSDNRMWSAALCAKRDVYVYVPPGYDPDRQYPVVFWLHGVAQDESSFLQHAAIPLDQAIACGRMPPAVIVCPDGSIKGHVTYFSLGSFYLDSDAGKFEQYLMTDVWGFVHERFSIRPEREAHALAGVSMGAGAAFHHAFKYADRVKHVAGIFPPLNTRWLDCHGRYQGNFDPNCWGWRTDYSRRREVVARFGLVFTIRLGQISRELYDKGTNLLEKAVASNPIEMLDAYDVTPGKFNLFAAYGGKDQFNIDAQVESFLFVARHKGIHVDVAYLPDGKHDVDTARQFAPVLIDWLAAKLAPYGPNKNRPAELRYTDSVHG